MSARETKNFGVPSLLGSSRAEFRKPEIITRFISHVSHRILKFPLLLASWHLAAFSGMPRRHSCLATLTPTVPVSHRTPTRLVHCFHASAIRLASTDLEHLWFVVQEHSTTSTSPLLFTCGVSTFLYLCIYVPHYIYLAKFIMFQYHHQSPDQEGIRKMEVSIFWCADVVFYYCTGVILKSRAA